MRCAWTSSRNPNSRWCYRGRSTPNCLTTVNSTRAITIQTANFETIDCSQGLFPNVVRRRRPATSNGFSPQIAKVLLPNATHGGDFWPVASRAQSDLRLLPAPTRKVSAERSRDAFGFIGLDLAEVGLEEFNQLAVPRHGRPWPPAPLGLEVLARKSTASSTRLAMRAASVEAMPDRLGAMSDTTTSTGGRQRGLQLGADGGILAKSPWMKCTPSMGSKSSRSSAMMVPLSCPTPPHRPAQLPWRELAARRYWLQAPGWRPGPRPPAPANQPQRSSISLSL